jgi:high-affinity nickel-transport protein
MARMTSSVLLAAISRCARIRRVSTLSEWRRSGLLAAGVLGLHGVGFSALVALVVPHGYRLGSSGVFVLSIGITVYTLGLRRAFDAGHIAAIDSTGRLMSEEQRR